MTLKMRNICVIPHGTVDVASVYRPSGPFHLSWFGLTVSEIPEIGELITPLRHDTESIFEECDDDEEPSYGWKIAKLIPPKVSLQKFPVKPVTLDAEAKGLTASVARPRWSTSLQFCSSVLESGLEDLDHS